MAGHAAQVRDNGAGADDMAFGGESIILDPEGRTLAKADGKTEKQVVADLDLQEVRRA